MLFISEHVDHAWNDRPASYWRITWWFNHTQRGKDLVHDHTETIMAATKCSLSCCVDLSVHRNGVSADTLSDHSMMQRLDLVLLLWAGTVPTWSIKNWEDLPRML